MLRLRSRQNSPVGGFIFVDAAISPDPIQTWDFQSLVKQVASRRAANPRFGLSTDLNVIAAEVDLANAQRMLSIRGADSFIVQDTEGGAANFPTPLRKSAPGAAVAERMMAGAGILLDWLGSGGKPVSNELANQRAEVCANRGPDPDHPGQFLKCPQNQAGEWTKWFTVPAAAVIQRQIEKRHEMKLETAYDSTLGICAACSCPLKLKVHTPIEHIKSKMPEEQRAKLDNLCWILAEG
jgi:hypothetical protein